MSLMNLRIGNGFDVHRFAENRKLILGGVEIPYKVGLLGHSDADVLVHAIMDSILGAARLGDIGDMFPDNQEKWQDANSIVLLEMVGKRVKNAGFKIQDIDSTIIAQEPKIAPHKDKMRQNIAKALNISTGSVGVKATTTEELGFIGKKEGIACSASAILIKE